MRDFSAGELERMRDTQEAAMQDTCRVLAYSSIDDTYNYPVPSYAAGDAMDCGLEMVDPEEIQGEGQVPEIDARIRLPLGTTYGPKDRIEVTHRYGEALTKSLVFEIVGLARHGPTGLVLDLRLVTDGTG